MNEELIASTEEIGEMFNDGEQTLTETVVKMLLDRKMTISSAESCTGGMFAQMLTEIAGVSAVFNESIVTYANEAKMKYLGVNRETLDKYGAVSEQTAYEMAEGICKNTGADVGVGITGIAGPDGGSAEKPVGLVYVGVCINGKVTVKKLNLEGDRQNVRYSACVNAYDMVRRGILEL